MTDDPARTPPNEVIEAIRARRSIRRFKGRPVTDDEVRTIVGAAHCAPSGANLQMWRFKAVRDPERIAGMGRVVAEKVDAVRSRISSKSALRHYESYVAYFGHFDKAPCVIAVQAETYNSIFTRISSRYAADLGAIDDAHLVNVATMSVSAAIQNMLLAAHSVGLGACWLTGPLVAQKELGEMLEVEAPYHVVALVSLGEPDHAPPPPERKPLGEVLSFDQVGPAPSTEI